MSRKKFGIYDDNGDNRWTMAYYRFHYHRRSLRAEKSFYQIVNLKINVAEISFLLPLLV